MTSETNNSEVIFSFSGMVNPLGQQGLVSKQTCYADTETTVGNNKEAKKDNIK